MSITTGIQSSRYASVEAMLAALAPSYPVYCVRRARIEAAARRFRALFPGRVLYAVKCNPHPWVLDALHAGGVRDFDTASLPEIALVCERYDDAVPYFQHPVKSPAAIEAACKVYGVRHFAIDHERELAKLVAHGGGGEAVVVYVRIATPPGHASHDLSTKFGAPPEAAAALLRRVAEAGCRPALSFHVGSQCHDPQAFRVALALVGEVLGEAGTPIAALDLGGGFPAPYLDRPAPPLEAFIEVIRAGVAALGLPPETELLAEPGRVLVADGMSLVAQVHLRKNDRLYINDGLFGSFSELLFTDFALPARLIRLDGGATGDPVPFAVFGPTCDPNDKLPKPVFLPAEAREGDWIEFSLIGAYSNALRTGFNGFIPETFVEIDES